MRGVITVSARMNEAGTLSADVIAPDGRLVSIGVRSVGSNAETIFTWNGLFAGGVWAPEGEYQIRVSGVDVVGNKGLDSPAGFAKFFVDRTGPALSRLRATPSVFSPDNDGSGDFTRFEFALNAGGSTNILVTAVVRATNGGNVRWLAQGETRRLGDIAYVWD